MKNQIVAKSEIYYQNNIQKFAQLLLRACGFIDNWTSSAYCQKKNDKYSRRLLRELLN